MKIAAFEQIKKSLQRVKGYTSNKVSELADATVAAIEEIENKKANTSHNHSADDVTSAILQEMLQLLQSCKQLEHLR